jgi:fructuronate reductase
VAEAIREPALRTAVESFWDEAERVLDGTGARDLEVPRYRRNLLTRFENARIEHRLAQISAEGSAKVRMRAVPVALAERAAGRDAAASLAVVAAWVAFVLAGEYVVDGDLDRVREAARGARRTAVPRLVALLSDELAQDRDAVSTVAEQVDAVLAVRTGR